MLVADSKWS